MQRISRSFLLIHMYRPRFYEKDLLTFAENTVIFKSYYYCAVFAMNYILYFGCYIVLYYAFYRRRGL